MSVGELRAFGDWRGCLFCVCAWFGINKCVVLLDCACCVFNIARVLVRAPIDEAGFPPTDTEGPHNAVKSVLSCPNVAPVATACVSSPKDWAVLTSSHMQQRSGHFFWRPTHLGAPVLIWTVHQQKYAKHKLQQLHVGKPRSKREIQRILRALLGDLSAPICTTETRGQ